MSSPERVERDGSPSPDARSPENPMSPLSPQSPDSVNRKRKFEDGESAGEEKEPEPEDEQPQEEEGEPGAEEDEEEDDNDAGYINPIVDGRNITFKSRKLNPYLVCSLCTGYFRDAHTIKECLHTFCKSCIYRYLDHTPQCPTCGIKCWITANSSSIKYDRQIQTLVDKIFPEAVEKDLEEEKNFYEARGIPMDNIKTGEMKKKEADQLVSVRLTKEEMAKKMYSDEVAFELKPEESAGEDLPRLERPYIRTTAKVSIQHLKKYLVAKLPALKSPADLELTLRGEVLGNEHSLEYILKTRTADPSSRHPVFRYRFRKVPGII